MALIWRENEMHRLLKGKDGPTARMLLRRGLRVESKAKELCAVDTGRLRGSIFTKLGEDSRSLYVDVGTNVSYAPYVEFGTRYTRAQPFLVPALKAAA